MAKFEKGNRYSRGRPLGSRNKSTIWLDELGGEGTEKAIRAVTRKAADGDLRAASILLARTWARRRGRPVQIELPPIEKSADLAKAQGALVAAVSRGEITPDEGADISTLLEHQRRAVETAEHEARISELERRFDNRRFT